MALVFRSSTLGPVHISLWCAGAQERDIAALSAELQLLVDASPERVLMILVVERRVSLASAGARSAAVKMLAQLGTRLGGVAVAIEGAGFGPAAMRSMFTGLGVLIQPGFPWKMFADASAASTWLLEQADAATPELAVVQSCIDELRAGRST